ncbi:MAG: GDP-L-fucose synthase [Pseudomonadota bacterium]|nr:GDP-L-fucose synthase [Pseudomonadota bacterium]
MRNDQKILVAGGNGLIGRACVKQLHSRGFENVLSPSRVELDLTNRENVQKYFRTHEPETVILAAGKVGGILENKQKPIDFLNQNLRISLNIAEAVHNGACSTAVLFGSSCMYPKECPQPMREEYLSTGPMEPTSLSYAVSKIATLQLGFAYNQQYSYDKFLCVIPNSAYGPGDNFDPNSGHVLSALIAKFHRGKTESHNTVNLWGSGKPRREFIFSEDVADAVIFLLENNYSTVDSPINIGSGADCSIAELADKIARTVGFQGSVTWQKDKPDGVMQKLLDSRKIKALGWRNKMTFDEGITKTYEWYANQSFSNDNES